jgi:ABC-type transporter Mla MlaB component
MERRPCFHNVENDVDLDISWLVPADLAAIDALARLRVTAARCGRALQLHGACGGLPELLDFCGLTDVLRVCGCDPGPDAVPHSSAADGQRRREEQ